MRNAIAGVVGLAFGLGLCLSGMNEPSKVLAFLDLAGDWDPSLAFVMGGAIALALPAFALARRQRIDWSGTAHRLARQPRNRLPPLRSERSSSAWVGVSGGFAPDLE